jgi:hypothetical protein
MSVNSLRQFTNIYLSLCSIYAEKGTFSIENGNVCNIIDFIYLGQMKKQIIETIISIVTSYAKEHKNDSNLDNKNNFSDVLCNFIKRIDGYFMTLDKKEWEEWIKNLRLSGLVEYQISQKLTINIKTDF